MNALSRRGLAGLAALALPAVPVAIAARVSPDADLIRLARAHELLGQAYNTDFPVVDSDDHPLALAAEARRDRNAEHRSKVLDQMMQAPPTTLAGIQAVAAALVVENLELLKPIGWNDDSDRLVALLVRGLLDMRGAA